MGDKGREKRYKNCGDDSGSFEKTIGDGIRYNDQGSSAQCGEQSSDNVESRNAPQFTCANAVPNSCVQIEQDGAEFDLDVIWVKICFANVRMFLNREIAGSTTLISSLRRRLGKAPTIIRTLRVIPIKTIRAIGAMRPNGTVLALILLSIKCFTTLQLHSDRVVPSSNYKGYKMA